MNRSRIRDEEVNEFELELVLRALAESTEVHGLRATARQLSMSPSGLRNLIDGAKPYGKTRRRVQAWYAQWSHLHGSLEIADRMAIGVLVSTVPADRREAAVEQLRDVVGNLRRG